MAGKIQGTQRNNTQHVNLFVVRNRDLADSLIRQKKYDFLGKIGDDCEMPVRYQFWGDTRQLSQREKDGVNMSKFERGREYGETEKYISRFFEKRKPRECAETSGRSQGSY